MIDVSVIIPTYNRVDALQRCLASVRQQTLAPARYEVLVVDDASIDQTSTVLAQSDGLRAFRQSHNKGPAAARNVGIRAARGTYVVFFDDDVVASPTVLEQHLDIHRTLDDRLLAILGKAIWPPGEPISPFNRYVLAAKVRGGTPYECIADRATLSYGDFITRHVSIRRDLLERSGLFDESFPFAYGEDTEIGYRLAQQGMRLVYRAEIVVQHHHARTYATARRAARRAGTVNDLMACKYPDLFDLSFLRLNRKSHVTNWLKRRGTEILLDPLLDLADRYQVDHPWLARAYERALHGHQVWGLHDAVRARPAK